jgi:excinuclease ABC subunit C
MVDVNGDLIYIGKAKCLRTRLLSYFRVRSRDAKAGRILGRSRAIVWEQTPSEFAALLRELELIRRWLPLFNVQGRPRGRSRLYVCLGRRPAPYVFLAHRPPAGALACFGPVPGGGQAREAVRRLNDWFGLRDCPQRQEMLFADQQELFPILRAAGCLRYEIGSCLGPCVGACTRADYANRVRAVRAFLAGVDKAPVEALERDMAAASAALAFERAAGLRDQLEVLRWLDDQLGRLRRARQRYSFLYPLKGEEGRELWYLIHHGHVAAVLEAPRDTAARSSAADVVEAVFYQKKTWAGSVASHDIDGVLLVSAWFRRHPEQKALTLEPAAALAACRAETPMGPVRERAAARPNQG